MPVPLSTRAAAALAAIRKYDFGQPAAALVEAERACAAVKGDAALEKTLREECAAIVVSSASLAARQAAARLLCLLGAGHTAQQIRPLTESSDSHIAEAARIALASSAPSAPRSVSPPAGFTALFDGLTFDGWEIDTAALWSIRNGVIIGSSPGLKYNEFLRTRKHYENFELHAKLRLFRGVGNTGIQFRSLPMKDSHEVIGYQADGGERYWGALYDESRRRKVLAAPDAAFVDQFDATIWHEYNIIANGPSIRIALDGIRTVDYTETDPSLGRSGFIALQVHSHPSPIEVWFRDIWIKTL